MFSRSDTVAAFNKMEERREGAHISRGEDVWEFGVVQLHGALDPHVAIVGNYARRQAFEAKERPGESASESPLSQMIDAQARVRLLTCGKYPQVGPNGPAALEFNGAPAS